MATGRVKWFNDNKGYGFIKAEDGTEVFVHANGIEGDGFKALAKDQEVVFEIKETQKGPQAINVRKVWSAGRVEEAI